MNKRKKKSGGKGRKPRWILSVTDGKNSGTLYFETDQLLQEAVLCLRAMGVQKYKGE